VNQKRENSFVKLLPDSHYYGVDSSRLSEGLLSAWNPMKDDFAAFLTPAGILLEGKVK